MILFKQQSRSCLVVGRGLVGSAVCRSLVRDRWQLCQRAEPSWSEPTQLADSWIRLLNTELADTAPCIIWAAGRAGFGASCTDAAEECEFYESTLARFGCRYNGDASILFISSAGALHEGNRDVTANARYTALRPYAQLKLDQEKVTRSRFSKWTVVRVSSVFGVRSRSMRQGLITALLDNGRTNQVTTLIGSPDTLRDYVFADDVGDGVVKLVNDQPGGIHYFVSGQPVSIRQAARAVEKTLGRRLLLRYGPAVNDADITFSPKLQSQSFTARPLQVAVAQLAKSLPLVQSPPSYTTDQSRAVLDVPTVR